MKTLKEKDKQSFLARKEEVYSLIMEMGSLLADYDHLLFKTSKFGNIKVRFPKDEDMDAELLVLDQLFDVE